VKPLQYLAENLPRLRRHKNLTQEGLSEKSGVEYKYLQKIEGGVVIGVRLHTINRLAEALGVEAWELICPVKELKPKKSRG
jgi:transcriptional regulator with XRE-family HTH domain